MLDRRSLFFLFLVLGVVLCAAGPATVRSHSSPIRITSDDLLADTKGRTAHFRGKVAARQDDVTIHADDMTVFYSADGGDVDRVECVGNVRVFQGNRTGTSGKAVYDNATGRIVMTVNPRVYQGEDMVTGTEIVYDVNGQTSTVTGGSGARVEAVIHPSGKKQDVAR